MDSLGITGGSDNEVGAGVKDRGATLEPDVIATNGDGERGTPEAVRVGVLQGDKGLRVEFGAVETSERDLAIIEAARDAGNLVRRDSLVDRPLLHKRFDRGRDTLAGEGRSGQAHDTVELDMIAGELLTFAMSNTKGVFTQNQAGDTDIVSNDVPLNWTSTVFGLPLFSGVLESG